LKEPERGEDLKAQSAEGTEQPEVSRRGVIGSAVAAASSLPLLNAIAGESEAAQASQGAPNPQAGGQPAVNPQRRMPQNGVGPIRVLLITKYHPFMPRSQFFEVFDSLGQEISWAHVEQPAAEKFLNPRAAEDIDVFVLYDMAGREYRKKPDGSLDQNSIFMNPIFPKPSPELRNGFRDLLVQGNKGFVFFHHALASWVHTWPEYVEVVGAAADWGLPITVRGKQYPYSGYRGGVQQHITVVDKTHPVVQGLGDGYDIEDETYLCPMFEDSVHCLLRTDFKPIDSNFPMQYARGWHHPPGSNMVGWVKTAENTPVVYLQNGHGPTAWANPSFRLLMGNAIRWANTPEAKSWAKANRSKIFS
jgi:type 1 glutamine amidotransferase